MAKFDVIGSYRFVYKDDAHNEIVCIVRADSDEDAIAFAYQAQRGFALEVWTGRRRVRRLNRSERLGYSARHLP